MWEIILVDVFALSLLSPVLEGDDKKVHVYKESIVILTIVFHVNLPKGFL